MPRSIRLLFVAALFVQVAAADTLYLGDGRSITGEVIKERPDALVVDLGFTVLTVPKSHVLHRETEPAKTAQVGSKRPGQLFVEASPGANFKESNVKELVERIGEAVVLVTTPKALGSGFLINEDGHVVTNFHVIEGEQQISVTLFIKRRNDFERKRVDRVRIVALNPFLDLALLKLELGEGRDLRIVSLPLGNIEDVKAGQPVFAIGSPLGMERSVSEGIVSTRKRSFEGILFIQTTAPINLGNSGGPLLNLRGEVIGVISMKAGLLTEGLGFAVPVNYLKEFLLNHDAFAFDKDNPNTGFRYLPPPQRKPTREIIDQ